jgi:hypothetical protein
LPAVACRIGRSVSRKDQVTGCGSFGCEFGSKASTESGAVQGKRERRHVPPWRSFVWIAAMAAACLCAAVAPRNLTSQLPVLSPWTDTTVVHAVACAHSRPMDLPMGRLRNLLK